MSEINTGGPAFPLPLGTANMAEPQESGGMMLRDYFAAKAMSAFIHATANDEIVATDLAFGAVAKMAYMMADAMLKAREGGAQ